MITQLLVILILSFVISCSGENYQNGNNNVEKKSKKNNDKDYDNLDDKSDTN